VIGSAAVAGYAAHVLFWAVLAIGAVFEELRRSTVAVFVLLWFCGVFGLPRLSVAAGFLTTPYVAILDIVLVFLVFKGDIRLS
jgi:hypothetical protein